MQFSLCLTNYNRFELLIESFEQVLDHPLISEVVISDDCSAYDYFDPVAAYCGGKDKIKLRRNLTNLGMSLNKKRAIEIAKEKYAILFDSDNILTPAYLEALLKWGTFLPNVINVPDFADPDFDYRQFSNMLIGAGNVKEFLGKSPMATCLLNTCNYVVHRERYLEVFQQNDKMKATDTVWFNYLWLKNSGFFYVVPWMRYFHRVHDQSGFMQDVAYNMAQSSLMINQIKLL
jgi:glycosyltransferase involved in cell wall biosynthesis